MKSKRFLLAIKWVYVIALLAAGVTWATTTDWSTFDTVEISFLPLLAGLAVTVLWVYWQSALWGRLLTEPGDPPPNAQLRNAFFFSAWVTRYVPGKVPGLASLAYFATRLGYSRQKGSLVAAAQTLLLATGMWGLALPAMFLLPGLPAIALVVFAGAGLALASGVFFLSKETFVLKFLRSLWFRLTGERLESTKPFRRQTVIAGGYRALVSGLILGVGQALLLWSISPDLTLQEFSYAVSLANLAVVSGVLAVFAPNGVGVREFILFAGVSTITSPAVGIAWALLSRVSSVGIDLALWGIYRLRPQQSKIHHAP